MKNLKLLFPVLMLVIFVSSFTMADTCEMQKETKKTAIRNLMVGLESDNAGLKISSAYYLGEYKANSATIPLMEMLHNGATPEQRIAAALSLYKIGSGRSIYAVKGAAKYDESPRVRELCRKLYNAYKYDQFKFSKDAFKGFASN